MSKKFISILAAIMVIGVAESKAQIGSFLKEKAQKAVSKSVEDKKAEQQKEEQQKQEQQQQEKQTEQKQKPQQQSNPANSFMQKKMMGMMGFNNVKYDLAYSYTSNLKMDMESVDSASTEVNKVAYTSYFDKNSKNFAMEFETVDKESGEKVKSLMIFDYKNMAMLILSDKNGEKSGIAMEIPKDSIQQNTTAEEASAEPVKQEDLADYNMYYKPTGRSKKIAGFGCKEYAYENPEGRVEIWATNDFKYDYSSAYGQMGGFQALSTAGFGGYLLGTVLEMHFKDSNSNARSDLFVREINPNVSKQFSIADYQIIGIGGEKGNGKNKK